MGKRKAVCLNCGYWFMSKVQGPRCSHCKSSRVLLEEDFPEELSRLRKLIKKLEWLSKEPI